MTTNPEQSKCDHDWQEKREFIRRERSEKWMKKHDINKVPLGAELVTLICSKCGVKNYRDYKVMTNGGDDPLETNQETLL